MHLVGELQEAVRRPHSRRKAEEELSGSWQPAAGTQPMAKQPKIPSAALTEGGVGREGAWAMAPQRGS